MYFGRFSTIPKLSKAVGKSVVTDLVNLAVFQSDFVDFCRTTLSCLTFSICQNRRFGFQSVEISKD